METRHRKYRQSDELVAMIQSLADLADTSRTTVVEMAIERLWDQARRGTRSRDAYEVRADLTGRAREIDERRREAVVAAQQEGQKKAREAGVGA